MITTADIPFLPVFFDRYIKKVDGMSLTDALDAHVLDAHIDTLAALGSQVYAPGKWTAPVMLQHLIDTERIMAYRALRIARGDTFDMVGFDEDKFADASMPVTKSVEELVEEFKIQRQATLLMYRGFSRENLMCEGITSGQKNSVIALGFTIAGHVIHHLEVFKDRYYPLLSA